MLRAKYFPDGDLLSASEQPGISYSWRSILRGIAALKQGLIWRIGNGERVNIWLDPWIPNAANRRPVTPRGQNVLNRVCDLIDPVTGTWDTQLVRDMFWEVDAELILSLQVNMEHEDQLAWHHDKKGLFNVKSAYHVLKDAEESKAMKQVGESSKGGNETQLQWLSIWKQKCQSKVLQFMWRLAHNSLPLRRNIKRRGMEADTLCPLCHRLDEDGGHLFLKCKAVKKCWQGLNLENIRCELLELRSGAAVVQHILQLKTEICNLVITCCGVGGIAETR